MGKSISSLSRALRCFFLRLVLLGTKIPDAVVGYLILFLGGFYIRLLLIYSISSKVAKLFGSNISSFVWYFIFV